MINVPDGYANPPPSISVSTGLSSVCTIADLPGNPQTPLPLTCGSGLLQSIAIAAGSVFCFGSNYNGEAGGPQAELGVVSFPEYPVAGSRLWHSVAPGHGFACGIAQGGTPLACWGSGHFGQTGSGSTSEDALIPFRVDIPDVYAWRSVAAGLDVAAAVAINGKCYTWGLDVGGKLGRPAAVPFGANTPGVVDASLNFTAVWGSYDHFLALAANGQLYAWGNGQFGRLGTGSSSITRSPTVVQRPTGMLASDSWRQCSAGGLHSCCVTEQGALACFGQQSRGRLGNGQSAAGSVPVPVLVGTGIRWASVSAGADHTLALARDGQLFAFGDNAFGQLGIGLYSPIESNVDSFRAVPTLTFSGETFTSAAAGARFSLGTTDDGILRSWGSGETSIGRGESEDAVPWPVAVATHILPTGTLWDGVSASAEGLCARVSFVPAEVYSAADENDIGLVNISTPLGCVDAGRLWTGTECADPPDCPDPGTSFNGYSCEPGVSSVSCADEDLFWDGAQCVSLIEAQAQVSIAPLPAPVPVPSGSAVVVEVALTFAGANISAFESTAGLALLRSAFAQTLATSTGQSVDASQIIILRVYIVFVPSSEVASTGGRRLQVETLVPVVRVDIALNTTSMALANLVYTALATANASDAAGAAMSAPLLQLLAAADPESFSNVGLLSLSPSLPRVVSNSPRSAPPVGASSTAQTYSAGAIAGIVIGVLAGVLCLGGLLLALLRRRKQGILQSDMHFVGASPPNGHAADSFAQTNPMERHRDVVNRRFSGAPMAVGEHARMQDPHAVGRQPAPAVHLSTSPDSAGTATVATAARRGSSYGSGRESTTSKGPDSRAE